MILWPLVERVYKRDAIGRFGSGGPLAFDSGADGHAQMQAAYADWQDGLSVREGKAYGFYASTEYKAVNGQLRDGRLPEAGSLEDSIVKNMDASLARTSVPEAITVYRATNYRNVPKAGHGLEPGETFTDRGFVSTSIGRKEGGKFGHYLHDAGAVPVVLKIDVPMGAKGGYLEGAPIMGDRKRSEMREYELVLPRNTTFRVKGYTFETFPNPWDPGVSPTSMGVLSVEVVP